MPLQVNHTWLCGHETNGKVFAVKNTSFDEKTRFREAFSC